MQTLLVDQLLDETLGNYRVERLLGHNRLNALYLARHLASQRTDALTLYLIPERLSPDARHRFLSRFLQGAAALKALQHKYILPVYEYGEYMGYPYLVTSSVVNGSLAEVLEQQRRFSPVDVLGILGRVLEGLEYAHRNGHIHGALKPASIIFGSGNRIQIANFGLMQMLQVRGIEERDLPYAHLLSIADTSIAAPQYIAPEVIRGQPADIRSDIYALGVIAFEMLSGRVPFAGANVRDVAEQHALAYVPSLRTLYPDIPIALELVVNRALERDPDRRFQSAGGLAEALAQAYGYATEQKDPLVPNIPVTSQKSGLIKPLLDSYYLPHLKNHSHMMSRRKLLAILAAVGVMTGGGVVTLSLTNAKKGSSGQSASGHATLIAHTTMAVNSAVTFTNPGDGQAGLLIRLPGGDFVAYEKACTHAGVYVNYDTATHKLICPAHGAIFDPADDGKVVEGPATNPLPKVTLRVNADGGITVT